MARRMNLSYNVSRDIEHCFMINAGFQKISQLSDFITSSSGVIETRKSPRSILNAINRAICQELFGAVRGYVCYLANHSPLNVWSIEPDEREKSLGHILYFPLIARNPDEIQEALLWNTEVNEASYKAYQSLIDRFFV